MLFCVKANDSPFAIKFVERSIRNKCPLCLFDELPCSNICKALLGYVNINENEVNR